MKLLEFLRNSAIALASVGLVVPNFAFAAGPLDGQPAAGLPASGPQAPAVRDVALHDGGVLRGQVVDAQGAAQPGLSVAVVRAGEPVAKGETGEDGRFELGDLHGGLYHIQTPRGGGAYRLWAPRTAPPSAEAGALIVTGNEIVRGQGHGFWRVLTNPWVIGGIAAAAIAIPLALDDDDRPTGS